MTDALCVPPDFNASSCSVSKKDTNHQPLIYPRVFEFLLNRVYSLFGVFSFLCLPSAVTSSLVGIWRLSLVFLCQGKHGHEIKSYFKLILIITFLRLTTQVISGPITGVASKNESESGCLAAEKRDHSSSSYLTLTDTLKLITGCLRHG